MNEYKPIPVEIARQIAAEFDKSIVIICAWDPIYGVIHATTYGLEPYDKINAAKGGDICVKALGGDLSKKDPHEDFRTVDAAKNAQIRDLAEGITNFLRSYEFGNAATGPAKEWADRLEDLIKPH